MLEEDPEWLEPARPGPVDLGTDKSCDCFESARVEKLFWDLTTGHSSLSPTQNLGTRRSFSHQNNHRKFDWSAWMNYSSNTAVSRSFSCIHSFVEFCTPQRLFRMMCFQELIPRHWWPSISSYSFLKRSLYETCHPRVRSDSQLGSLVGKLAATLPTYYLFCFGIVSEVWGLGFVKL